MSYQVLARKWRPRSFGEMVGQEHVLKALINALDHNRLHHAYLFTGTRGVGKTTVARILAKCLNCETGVGSTPCGVCSTCTEINEGRFVDLIEVDAASRTKVEDTRELLDNVQYSPTSGRFKIYLIDEVHMLSTSSFNALLKTLEEPPEHVKFLLATTDPQKLPATILSRCLQFNLKNMSPEKIVAHLQVVLGEEMVPCEESALWQLARSADGSMRDALSLTDQAIAFGNGKVSEIDVTSMLGTIDHKFIQNIIEALIHTDGAKLLNAVALFAEHAPDYIAALADLQTLLHRIAIAQALPEALDNSYGDRQSILQYATQLAPEDVQLFYQTALMGQRDISLCQIPRTGFEMVLLRMLAFKPQGVADVPTQTLPVVEPSAGKGPSAGSEPSANIEPSANKEPSADKEPSAGIGSETPVTGAVSTPIAQNAAEADPSKKHETVMAAAQPDVAIADVSSSPQYAAPIDSDAAQRPPWEAAPAALADSSQHPSTPSAPVSTETPAPALTETTLAKQEPLANQKPLANQEPLAHQEPLAKEPSVSNEPSAGNGSIANPPLAGQSPIGREEPAVVTHTSPPVAAMPSASEQAYDEYANIGNAPSQAQPAHPIDRDQHNMARSQNSSGPSAMDAFTHADHVEEAAIAVAEPVSQSSRALQNIQASRAPSEPALSFEQFNPDQWIRVFKQLPISGVLKMTAANLICTAVQPSEIYFLQDEQAVGLLNTEHALGLGEALTAYFGFPLRANIQVSALDGNTETPAQNKARLREERRLQILADLRNDHFVQSLQQHFAATLDEHSLTITEED